MFQGRQQCRVSKGRPSTCLPPGGPELPSLTGRAAPRQAAHRESKGQAPSRRMGTVSAVLPCEPGQGQGTHRGHPGGIGRRWTKKNAARRRQILSVASAAVGGLCSRHLTYQDPAHTRAASGTTVPPDPRRPHCPGAGSRRPLDWLASLRLPFSSWPLPAGLRDWPLAAAQL